MGAMASQVTRLTQPFISVSIHQRKHQSSASLAFVRAIHRWPVNSPHKWPVTQKMFPFDDVIMNYELAHKVELLGVFREFRVWTKFFLSFPPFRIVFNIVLYSTAIDRKCIVPLSTHFPLILCEYELKTTFNYISIAKGLDVFNHVCQMCRCTVQEPIESSHTNTRTHSLALRHGQRKISHTFKEIWWK